LRAGAQFAEGLARYGQRAFMPAGRFSQPPALWPHRFVASAALQKSPGSNVSALLRALTIVRVRIARSPGLVWKGSRFRSFAPGVWRVMGGAADEKASETVLSRHFD
jgi:hypothetical protein